MKQCNTQVFPFPPPLFPPSPPPPPYPNFICVQQVTTSLNFCIELIAQLFGGPHLLLLTSNIQPICKIKTNFFEAGTSL